MLVDGSIAKVIVKGNKSDISYNNLVVKHKYVYGVSTDYSGKLIFKGLIKMYHMTTIMIRILILDIIVRLFLEVDG